MTYESCSMIQASRREASCRGGYSLFTTTDLAFALGDFEFAIEDIVKPHIAFLPPPRWRKLLILDDFLDNSLNGRRLERRLGYTGRTGRGN